MSRVAVCLFFFAILHYGIQESLQNNDTSKASTEDSGKSNAGASPVDEAPVKKEQDKAEPKEEKNNGNAIRTSPLADHLTGLGITGTLLEPLYMIRTKIGETVNTGMDGVKKLADSTINFFKGAAGKIF